MLVVGRAPQQPRLRKYRSTRQVIYGASVGPQTLGRANPARALGFAPMPQSPLLQPGPPLHERRHGEP
jgi:hypothetical protein